ncbi:MAG TPA: Hpt domain-containing protein [Candidatus Acidoferrum sp.]|nr:Hpt domain-containing protein [Candidatus Acidoferrum sp.]
MTQLVIDRKVLLESLENDAEFLRTIIGIFLADCPGKLAATRAAVVARNLREVMLASHSLKGSVGVFGAKSAVEAAQNLESLGREGKQEGVDEAFALLEREMALVTFALQEIVKDAT